MTRFRRGTIVQDGVSVALLESVSVVFTGGGRLTLRARRIEWAHGHDARVFGGPPIAPVAIHLRDPFPADPNPERLATLVLHGFYLVALDQSGRADDYVDAEVRLAANVDARADFTHLP